MTRTRFFPNAAAAALGLFASCARAPGPPSADTSGMEARVVERIDEARRHVLEAGGSEAWGRLGRVFHAHALMSEATLCYETAAKLDPSAYQWRHLLAHATRASDPDRALQWATEATERNPNAVESQYLRARILEDFHDVGQAIEGYERVLAVAPETAAAELALGRLYLDRAKPERAEKHLLAAMRLQPGDRSMEPYLRRARAMQGKDPRAGSGFRPGDSNASVEFPDPLLEEVMNEGVSFIRTEQRAQRAMADGRLDEAVDLRRELVAIRPQDPRTRQQLAVVLLAANKYNEAEIQLRSALSLDPAQAEARVLLGDIFVVTRRYEDASSQFQWVLDNDPSREADAFQGFGRLYASRGKLDESLEMFRRALASSSDPGTIHSDIARVRAEQGDFEAAWSEVAAAEALGLSVSPAFKETLRAAASDRRGSIPSR